MLDQCGNPEAYARKLATYISDPSTIRARTLDFFGRAPSIVKCAELRAKYAGRKGPSGRRYEAISRPETFTCGHEISDRNTYLSKTGSRLCATCRDEKRAKAIKPPRVRHEPKGRDGKPIVVEVPPPRSAFLVSDLIARAAAAFQITVADIYDERRDMQRSYARAVIAYVLRDRGMSYPKIGNHLKRDHSSAIHMVKNFEKKVKRCPDMARIYEALR